MRVLLWISLLCYSVSSNAQNRIEIDNLITLQRYAENHSANFKNANENVLLATYTRIASQWGVVNLTGNANASMLDNVNLPQSFIPAEFFGGKPGTFKTVTFGQQYVSNLTLNPQIDIINPSLWARIQTAKANEGLSKVNRLITKKNLLESVAAAYYNVLSLQEQLKSSRQLLLNNDTLAGIFANKFNEGLIRVQDLNNVQANQLLINDKVQQLEKQLEIQIGILKGLCDIPLSQDMIFSEQLALAYSTNAEPLKVRANLLTQQGRMQEMYQRKVLNADQLWLLPNISMVSNFMAQQNTNNHFFDEQKVYFSNYYGLRLSMPIIPDVNKIANVRNDRINLQIARNNAVHAALQDSIN
ncbi:MAG: TolC family protein, partial [Chitinophagales bacterium]|nr:TolC family protein [Chitinophagales bacterium]